MPILPLVDLMILLGWTSLMIGFLQKAIWASTLYRPGLFGLTPSDFLTVGAICLIFALALAARTWVKLNEPKLLSLQASNARERARRMAGRAQPEQAEESQPAPMAPIRAPETASADHR